MSKKRIISESVNIRINVGNYQHIEITKQAQEEIEYDSEEQRLKLEEALQNDLISGIISSMKKIPEKLGKGVASVQEVEQAISKAIPEWLDKGPVPNIANEPKKNSDKVALEQKANKDQAKEKADSLLAVEEPKKVVKTEVKPNVEDVSLDIDVDVDSFDDVDLFEDDEPPVKSEVIVPVVKAEAKSVPAEEKVKEVVSSTDDFDFFDDDVESLFN